MGYKGRVRYRTVSKEEQYEKFKTETIFKYADGKYSLYAQEVQLTDQDLETGDYEIPFSISVPSDIIGTLHYRDPQEGKEAHCSHFLVAENSHCCVKQELIIFERNSADLVALRKTEEEVRRRGCCWEENRPVKFGFQPNNGALDLGSQSKTGANLDVLLMVDAHGQEDDIELIEVEIRQFVSLYGHDKKTGEGLGEMKNTKNLTNIFRREEDPTYFKNVLEGKVPWKVALTPETASAPLFHSTLQGRMVRIAAKILVKVQMKKKGGHAAHTLVSGRLLIANTEDSGIIAENLANFENFSPKILPVVVHSLKLRERLPKFLYDKNDITFWHNSMQTPLAKEYWEREYEMSDEALQAVPAPNRVVNNNQTAKPQPGYGG